MAKQTTDEVYPVYRLDLGTLRRFKYETQISPNITRYSTDSPRDAIEILQDAKYNDQRVHFAVHDQISNLMIPLGSNVGHSPGIDPDYILEYGTNPVWSLDEALHGLVPGDREIIIDWFLVDVISNWRNPRS